MNPVTACCLVVASVSLILLLPANASPFRKRAGQVLAGIVLLVGIVRLVSNASGINLGIDQWLFRSQLANGTEPPSRIALRTAIDLVLASSALLLLDTRTARGRRPTELLCACSGAIAFLALIGYSYGLFLYYKTADFVPMSLPGSIAFLLLATGTLLARPDEGIMRIITSDTPAGLLSRLLLPLAVLLPVLLGALQLAGVEAGWYSTRLGVALFMTTFIVLFLISVAWTTRLLFRSDIERKAAEDRARQINAELEQRVAARTLELNSLNKELVAASKTKDNFLAALSHELRTPLTPVLMTASALERDQSLHPQFREQLSMMRRNVELEARLIDDLLDLTRISRDKLVLHMSTANIHLLLEQTGEIIKNDAQEKGVQIQFALEARNVSVAGYGARLHQVFWNVLKNAIKFTPAGGEISVQTSNSEDGAIIVEVVDNGAGIDPAILPKIFSAFVQGETTPGRNAAGLGLGMTISKKVVELHGGTITAASDGLGKGTTFTVALKTIGSASAKETAAPGFSVVTKHYRLLVVEDHQPTLEVLARLLRRAGHDVATASTVETALATAGRGQFDLVISDLGLPDGNGIDLMVRLTHQYGLRGNALSGYGMEADFAKTKQAGFVAHLIKPIDFQRLSEALEQFGRAA